MKNTIALVLNRNKLLALTQLSLLIGVAVAAPLFHNQFITGPIVNATLFIAAALLGTQAGIIAGLIPSVIALSAGTLPVSLSPMVPFIMLSNAIMVIIFGRLSKKYWLAVVLSSFAKFLFLSAASSAVTGLLLKKELSQSVAAMMSWPQFFTALAGGFLAYCYLKIFSMTK